MALFNRLTVSRLRDAPPTVEQLTVCIPARNERDCLPHLVADLRVQRGVPNLRVLILDDDSSDDTGPVAEQAFSSDTRFELHRRSGPPRAGWTGKSAACRQLSELARTESGVLIFLDADVRLAPDALAAAVAHLRRKDAALVAPWPFQAAVTSIERLVQPLLCWSWAASLPIVVANRELRPTMVVACGQFLVFDADAYRSVGGHSAVAASVTEDLDIARALRRAGRHTVLVSAAGLASCRMYSNSDDIEQGYTRWLWSAHGSAAGSVAASAVALLAWVGPPLGMLSRRTRRWGFAGYAAAVASRLLARSLESPERLCAADAFDAALHPLSTLTYVGLTARSHRAHRTGRLSWKGRTLDASRGQT
ncbi:glycosyltransferase [Antrihabitans sp. YC2-6]|nr:glycosyltransferase [Antrihabitans sp. YC2-6]